MSREQTMTRDQMSEFARCQKLQPKESEFAGKPGFKRTYRPDGTYSWRYRYTTNVKGKLTREAQEVHAMMRPFAVADTERHARNEAKKDRAVLKDERGRRQFVDPALADAAARRNGWSHSWRARGTPVERGLDGMLFRLVRDEWEPLGVRCLGIPLRGAANVSRRGVQRDPDGNPWSWRRGAWRTDV